MSNSPAQGIDALISGWIYNLAWNEYNLSDITDLKQKEIAILKNELNTAETPNPAKNLNPTPDETILSFLFSVGSRRATTKTPQPL